MNHQAACKIKRLDIFKEFFHDFTNHYALIGGAVCDIVFNEVDQDFRATKDFDMVFLILKHLGKVNHIIAIRVVTIIINFCLFYTKFFFIFHDYQASFYIVWHTIEYNNVLII